ncbi:protein-lysine N-methyltransferase [Staphylothermus hellenicus]|uniref:Putative RNA methylase n=1 Tax=Staphylothermus hellenicus (strain DSM 12710 / JCM 10830 / BK20S6-10-b1 / P8) TaxID=591019 RepID=D7DA84_STAHD|nr:protein-lysine N-methyltransferase [Staphylothermus hellenicus]ADI32680.1 putative RNA methylase [Staphylothermus hellenicus DSM 12710]
MPYHVPYVPTPLHVARMMLKIAGAGPSDIVYDLGCGDGRILIIAVKEFNVKKAVGIDKDPERIREARKNAEKNGVSDRIVLINDDIFNVDISKATIVTMFLLTIVNEALRPKLEKELMDGARIVSHEFRIPGWKPSKVIDVRDNTGLTHTVYLYVKGKHK